MEQPLIIGLGELLWDIFPDYKRPGGAPANVSYHANLLGNRAITLSRIGNDADGEQLYTTLKQAGVDLGHLQTDHEAPTGTVRIQMHGDEAAYTIVEDVAWDRMQADSSWLELAGSAQAICFGTLAQRSEPSRSAIRSLLSHAPASCLKVADINLRPPHFSNEIIDTTITWADVVKLNREEWVQIQALYKTSDLASFLFQEKNVRIVCLTKGREGAELITPEAHLLEPVHAIDNSNGDSVGVGDAFTACLTHHLLRNTPVDVALASANRYAAHVSACKGAMPSLSEEVLGSVT